VAVYSLSSRDAAEVLGVSEDTIRRLADRGFLSFLRLPSGYRRFAPEDVARLRESLIHASDAMETAGCSQ
jgi:excisionase family DNA binding protein